jgi:hypothetical protein
MNANQIVVTPALGSLPPIAVGARASWLVSLRRAFSRRAEFINGRPASSRIARV